MRACGLLTVGVALIYLADQHEVSATPIPDPCSIIFTPLRPSRKTTTTTLPQTEKDREIESRMEKVKIFETLLEEILLGAGEAPREPASGPDKPRRTAPAHPDTMDVDAIVTAYLQFLRRFFRMLQ